MVIGRLQQKEKSAGTAPTSAWAQIEAVQRDANLPCLLIPQPSHAVLAGELADGLLDTAFGPLPPDIKRAIQMHDTGWAASDAQQIQRLRSTGGQSSKAISFIAIPHHEAEEAWTASIDTVEAFSKSGAAVVSRHFTLIAEQDPSHHHRFIQAERSRQQTLKAHDLHRWTDALGFCDLVSLLLVSGISGELEIPLSHPSSPQAGSAPRVKLHIEPQTLRFTPAIVRAGCTLTLQALKHPVPAQGPRGEALAWEVL